MEENTLPEMLEIWKNERIGRIVLQFSCGGDSMNDMTWEIYDADDNLKDQKSSPNLIRLVQYMENDVFQRVNFYDISDGHYMGEMGTVTITAEEDYFSYEKDAMMQFEEMFSDNVNIKLDNDEIQFLKDNVERIMWDNDNTEETIYSRDMILNENDMSLMTNVRSKIMEVINNHTIKIPEGDNEYAEYAEYCEYESVIAENLNTESGVLQITFRERYHVDRPSEDY
jgi:DNA repair exonuclease SbcCD nuclease subunit